MSGVTRDGAWEAEFLGRVVETAQRLCGNASYAYPARVGRRLAEGQALYGDEWRDKDCLAEVLEETPDLAGYGMLEIQRLRAQGADPGLIADVELDLLAVAAYGCIADYFALRAARRIRGIE